MLALSLILAALMILTAVGAFGVRSLPACGAWWIVWFVWWGLVLGVVSASRFAPAVGWLYPFLAVAFPATRWATRSRVLFSSVAAVGALAAYGIAVVEYVPVHREHRELLAKYPAVDLKPRLAYERSPAPVVPADGGAVDVAGVNGTPKYDVAALGQLDEMTRVYLDLDVFRVDYRRNDRRLALQGLMRAHEGFVADFVAQPGFGRSRLPGIRLLRKESIVEEWDGVRLDVPPALIDQPDAGGGISAATGDTPADYPPARSDSPAVAPRLVPIPRIPSRRNLQRMHFHNITNFAPRYSLGGVDEDLMARGFDAHAFHIPLHVARNELGWSDYQLSRIELVSLLKHRPPAVYVSDHLPAMDELRDAPTRPTTPFESAAVAKLVEGEEVIVEPDGRDELVMVGAIRALADCRDCHRVPLGGLLGAFSYRLRRSPVAEAGAAR